MDPFLEIEPYWSDFTPGLLKALANELLSRLLPRYDVRVEKYLYVAHEEIRLHRVRPDISLVTTPAWAPAAQGSSAGGTSLAELEYPELEPSTQRHLKVIHNFSGRVVTVVELLSPTNKRPGEDGLDAYLEKRAEFLASRCNLVEIDLLRGGERLPMQGSLPPGDYYMYVGRVHRRPRCQIIGWPLRAPIPDLPVPLLAEDGDVTLSMQGVFTAAYEPSFYDRRLPYDQPLAPPLAPDDETWVRDGLGNR
jgi:hypothetical protein